jgi:hypothetical protein
MMEKKIEALDHLGDWILSKPDDLELAKLKSKRENVWFDLDQQDKALQAIATQMLRKSKLRNWLSKYSIQAKSPKAIGLILAGNIPAVGFHDVLCVYLSGHSAKVKLSEKDKYLIPAIIKKLQKLDPDSKQQLSFAPKLKGIDALIATGSNNSSRYFKKYFGHLPNIIRANRNSLAVIDQEIHNDELAALGNDIFDFYGLGCRSVSQIILPENFDENRLFQAWEGFSYVIENPKYENNYKYNYATFILNNENFKTNNFLIIKESEEIISRISCVHIKRYRDIEQVLSYLDNNSEKIQICVSNINLNDSSVPIVKPGTSQKPALSDYADGIDTIEFLNQLS